MPTGDKYFRLRLNVAVDDRMSFSSVGGRFHAQGAATENARVTNSPIGSWLEEVSVGLGLNVASSHLFIANRATTYKCDSIGCFCATK